MAERISILFFFFNSFKVYMSCVLFSSPINNEHHVFVTLIFIHVQPNSVQCFRQPFAFKQNMKGPVTTTLCKAALSVYVEKCCSHCFLFFQFCLLCCVLDQQLMCLYCFQETLACTYGLIFFFWKGVMFRLDVCFWCFTHAQPFSAGLDNAA